MRRTEVESISVSIIPASGASAERAEILRRFKKDGLKTLNGEEFLKIFNDACTAMGVSTSAGPPATGRVTFSADMLKIELTGPTRQNLSMIDIPGIFRNPTPGVTTKDDITLINSMVRNFMKDERTIILAVLGANVDLATQEILTMAEEADPKGIRTLGILTKPDLVDKSAEKNVIDLIRGKSCMKLRLGYCIVRNRAQNELSSNTLERAAKEKAFFNSAPWSAVEKDRAGINSLKARLQELLGEITSRELPKVKQQIDRQLASARKQLNDLGQERETSDQQRRFLPEIAGHFQKITDHALDAYYSRGVVFDKIPELRLPTLVIDRSDKFNNDIMDFGHAVEFAISGEPEDDYDKDKGTHLAGARGTSVKIDPENEEQWLVMSEEKLQNYPELTDLVSEEPYILQYIPKDVLSWIKGVYLNARGCGLDSIGPAVFPTLWQEQSRNWDGITRKYIGDIIIYVHDFINKLLQEVCPDEHTRINLLLVLGDLILECYERTLEHLSFVIKVEVFSTPHTMDTFYNNELQRLRNQRIQTAMSKLAVKVKEQDHKKMVALDQIGQAVPMGNVDFTVRDIHSILKAYYKVARKRFVDTVCMQVTDYHLLNSEGSPLRIFSPLWVGSLSNEKLESIAGEELTSKRLRKNLNSEIKALEDGRKILRA